MMGTPPLLSYPPTVCWYVAPLLPDDNDRPENGTCRMPLLKLLPLVNPTVCSVWSVEVFLWASRRGRVSPWGGAARGRRD